MPRVCYFLYFIINLKKPRVCSRGKKIYFSRTHELMLLTNPTNELNLLTNPTHELTPLTLLTLLNLIYIYVCIYKYIRSLFASEWRIFFPAKRDLKNKSVIQHIYIYIYIRLSSVSCVSGVCWEESYWMTDFLSLTCLMPFTNSRYSRYSRYSRTHELPLTLSTSSTSSTYYTHTHTHTHTQVCSNSVLLLCRRLNFQRSCPRGLSSWGTGQVGPLRSRGRGGCGGSAAGPQGWSLLLLPHGCRDATRNSVRRECLWARVYIYNLYIYIYIYYI